MKTETNKPLLCFCRICWLSLTLFFFVMNFMTISWFIEEKNLNGKFYLFDYMIEHMERGKAVDLYYSMCDMSFHGINPFFVKPIAIIISLILLFISYNEKKINKKFIFKYGLYILISCLLLFIAFIAYPFAQQAYFDDLASI